MEVYNQGNVNAIIEFSELFFEARKFDNKYFLKTFDKLGSYEFQPSHHHILHHATVHSNTTGLSEKCSELFYPSEVEAYGEFFETSERYKFKPGRNITPLKEALVILPTFELHLDCELFLRRNIFDLRFFIYKLMPGNIKYLNNYWNDKNNIVFQIEENKSSAIKIFLYHLIIISNFVESDNDLSAIIIRSGLEVFRSEIKQAAKKELEGREYEDELLMYPEFINKNPTNPFPYSDEDANFIKEELLNPYNDSFFGRLYRIQYKRLLKLL
jgi:hypothetical protein